MSRWLRNVLGVTVLLWGSNIWAQETPVIKYYGIEHAIIEYEISNSGKGKERLFFDQFGLRQARYRVLETEKWGVTNTITFNFRDEMLYVDPNKGIGQKKRDDNLKILLETPDVMNAGLLSLQLAIKNGGQKIGDENILSQPCEVWTIPTLKLKVWLWNGIALKSVEETPEGKVTYKATKIDVESPVEDAAFTIPEGIRFIDKDINQILLSKR